MVPPSDSLSNSFGGKLTSGDECYPTKITLGDFLAILDSGKFKRDEVAFFMATADGPCRFGQYFSFMRRTLDELGYHDIPMVSLTSRDAYHGLGNGFERTAWRGIVATDILRKLLHMTRPYEKESGETDSTYRESVETVCKVLERKSKHQMKELLATLVHARDRFRAIETIKKGSFPLIGVVGEIFCRLNTFSNEDLIRKMETYGAEAWLAGVGEWILYTNTDEIRRLKERKKYLSKQMLKAIIKRHILLRDEHIIYKLFKDDLKGREEAPIKDILKYGLPYLPWYGSLGEMTLSAGGAVYCHKKGCAGVINISSFGCMNEIVSEAVYPKISHDLGGFPMKVFYFDGTSQNLDRDLQIFLELARNYAKRYPQCRLLAH